MVGDREAEEGSLVMSERAVGDPTLGPWETLPAPLRSGVHPSGVICPECGGILTVEVKGPVHLHFVCRVGHAFSLEELLELKKDMVERQLWTLVYHLEEFAALLGALEREDRPPGNEASGRQRRRALQHHVAAIRDLIEHDGPLRLRQPGGGEVGQPA
jgi:hypothetical protein